MVVREQVKQSALCKWGPSTPAGQGAGTAAGNSPLWLAKGGLERKREGLQIIVEPPSSIVIHRCRVVLMRFEGQTAVVF